MMTFEICFTGFKSSERDELEQLAKFMGLLVKKNVTKNLHILCVGENAGPSKVEQGIKFGALIIDKSAFVHFSDSGELAESDVKQLFSIVESRSASKSCIQSTPRMKSKKQPAAKTNYGGLPLNKDAQPYGRVNHAANIEKAVCSLHGILLGISADSNLNPAEHAFLDLWLKSHDDVLDDPDMVDIADLIYDVIADGIIEDDEYDDLFSLIHDVIDIRGFGNDERRNQINQLLGLLQGISADDEINDKEVSALANWLQNNSEILDTWPANILATKVCDILEDGVISEDEKNDLLGLIQRITGSHFCETGDASDNTTECFDDIQDIPHDNVAFCFTGKFSSGCRKDIEKKAQNLGAITTKDVLQSTQFLVIGSQASRDWKYQSHGRKIERAMTLKARGQSIFIVSEEQWLAAVNEHF